VRVNERETVAAFQVLERHSFQQRRLSGAGLPYNVDVRKAVFGFDAEDAPIVSKIDTSKVNGMRNFGASRPKGGYVKKMPPWPGLRNGGELARSAHRPPFGPPVVPEAAHTSRLASRETGKSLLFTELGEILV
jgi:hypothetical protein